jgi:transcriptional regulator NrdR family protein
MLCPHCNSKTAVVYNRVVNTTVQRRRACLTCGGRFNTQETPYGPVVEKRDYTPKTLHQVDRTN